MTGTHMHVTGGERHTFARDRIAMPCAAARLQVRVKLLLLPSPSSCHLVPDETVNSFT